MTVLKAHGLITKARGCQRAGIKSVYAQERSIRLALPKEGDEWRCYIGQRLVGEGDISEPTQTSGPRSGQADTSFRTAVDHLG
ncbi:hypothetical protein [Rhizobium leguminosarum]|uniref:hypothetical protein n=1 Tax=Rhizobium leguminosarum TaxID=384 RepID=UPI0014427AE0|nr:hypothetical protein [Rhizobium leguminosarum]MBY5868497.1 hypothetical protein [Rhizobium leguminosarum]NKM07726.1 hypothetical protein [Rhizobium leguminosarum bv. viciae]